jgi:lysophospholipase L1-like esterase
LFLFVISGSAQINKFDKEVLRFKRLDSLEKPADGMILLIGSSSFTMWKDVNSYFPDRYILNRAFGGSTFKDLFHYADDVIFAYKPKQILIYCGDNDLSNQSISPQNVYANFVSLYGLIREKLGEEVKVSYVSIKPSPSRVHNLARNATANKLIQDFIKTETNASFIDVTSAMLGEDGKPIQELFISDNLHINAVGYGIWKEIIAPHLVENK